MTKVIIPLNAFDTGEVLENGQASFVELIAQADAHGIEIRRELLSAENLELEKIKGEIDKYGLFTVYSAPIECWEKDHQLNKQRLNKIIDEGIKLGAKWIKVSLGHFHKQDSNIADLAALLQKQPGIQLLIENDQTPHGGNIEQLQAFFESAAREEVPVKMTFDAGNWYYSGQDVDDVLRRLASHVMYLHLKQVEVQKNTLETVPLEWEGNHSWKKVMGSLPADIVKALEFPIVPKEKTVEFIKKITEKARESEALLK